ncbi:hypothetical protein Trydic_g8220 [Trypoxylus dichotomus]
MIGKVRGFTENDRNSSLKMMEEDLNTNEGTIGTIIQEDLGKTVVSTKFIPHTLTDDQTIAPKFPEKSLQPPETIQTSCAIVLSVQRKNQASKCRMKVEKFRISQKTRTVP